MEFEPLLLGSQRIESCFGMHDAIIAVERSFEAQAHGKVVCPAKLYLDLPEYQGDFRAMPCFIDSFAGIKWVSVYPRNPDAGLPTIMATVILCDPRNGSPVAILDGRYITSVRTGAAGAVAAKYLAREGSSTIGIVGAGAQARTQLVGLKCVIPHIEFVKVFDQNCGVSQKFASEMTAELGIPIRDVALIDEAVAADIVVTTTPSRRPIVERLSIRAGTHINAIGADAKGKEELSPELLKASKIIVDDVEQAWHSGEINVPAATGRLTTADIYGTLGEVVAGMKKGRESQQEITIFDSTGLALQDVACAAAIYRKCLENHVLSQANPR